jgi:hypothetical protein
MQAYSEFFLMTLLDRYTCLTITSGENPSSFSWKSTFKFEFIILLRNSIKKNML